MPITVIQFRPGLLTVQLEARGAENNAQAGQLAQRDLDHYYRLLALSLTTVELLQDEASLIVDALNGTMLSLDSAQLLVSEIQDSYQDGLLEKWGVVNGPGLLQKLASYSLVQRLAIVDAAARFWEAPQVPHMADRLAAVGLIRRP